MDGLIIAACSIAIFIVLNNIRASIDEFKEMLESKINEATGNGENKNE